MRLGRFVRWCGLMLCLCGKIAAQTPFSVLPDGDSMSAYFFHNQLDSINFPRFYRIDTVLAGIEQHQPSRRNLFADLGNTGQAQLPMLFSWSHNTDFRYKTIPYYGYISLLTQPRFYRSVQPYSELYYLIGAKKEQALTVRFSSNLYRGLTVGLEFDVRQAPGFYLNSKSFNNNLNLHLRYFTDDYRYGIVASFLRYKIENQENGGIRADSIFEQQLETARVTPVHLETGSNTLRNWGFEVSQFFNFTRPDFRKKTPPQRPVLDSIAIDSLLLFAIDTARLLHDTLYFDSIIHWKSIDKKRPFNWGRISLDLKYHEFFWLYDNARPTTAYFNHLFNDSLHTHDSINHRTFTADFGYSNLDINRTQQPFYYYLYIKYAYDQVKNGSRFLTNHQLTPHANIVLSIRRRFEFRASGSYVLTGYRQQDASLTATLSHIFGKNRHATRLWATASYSAQMPDWFYGFYSGNHFQWETSLQKMRALQLSIGADHQWISLHGDYFLVSNYTFLNNDVQPEQASKTQNVLRITAQSKVDIGKFTLDQRLAFQETFQSAALYLPQFIFQGSYYFRFYLFHRALLVQPGISLFYNTSYFADAYQPAINSFYLQTDKKVGNYLYGDLFIDFYIKRARLFVKYSHLTQGIFPYTYYLVPHYPQPGGGVYFGVSWRLFG